MEYSRVLTTLLIAWISNLDNLGIGVSYGTRRIGISALPNLIIASITGLGTLVSMLAGATIAQVLSPGAANTIGMSVIIAVGLWIFVFEVRRSVAAAAARSPQAASARTVGISEALLLGWGLAMNNMANGIAAGMLGLNPALATCAAFTISLCVVWFGGRFGSGYAARLLGRAAGPVAGVLLMMIGLYEIFLA